jgi:guanine deaminase
MPVVFRGGGIWYKGDVKIQKTRQSNTAEASAVAGRAEALKPPAGPAERFMRIAVRDARRGYRRGDGGPFGAVVVIDGRIVGRGWNRVLVTRDPTAHAEIVAIRRASRRLGRYDLSDAVLYATCEPCPMCLAAIHWARIRTCYFGCTTRDAARIGFDDKMIYESCGRLVRSRVASVPFLREECLPLFEEWSGRPDRVIY